MQPLRLQRVLKATGGRITQGARNPLLKRVTFSQRKVKDNTLFFHSTGRRLNSKVFSNKRGVTAITERPSVYDRNTFPQLTVVAVENLNQAYWNFVKYYRNLFSIPVIGVTGTCGKTTTVEMIKAILAPKYSVQSTYPGRNAQALNLPYLLGINENTGAAVYELAVGSPGCIRTSCEHFQPTVGVLLNIGVYHLDWCETLDNYIKAKAEILEGLACGGTLIINADDENIRKIDFSQFKGDLVKISLKEDAHYRGQDVSYEKSGMCFQVVHQNKAYPAYIPGYGEHNVYNALAAIAATVAIGIPLEEAIESLASFKHVTNHLQLHEGINGCTIIDDTWNCNPSSMKASLDVLREMAKERKKIAVLGPMPRLGEAGRDEYNKIGKKVVQTGVDVLVVIGEEAKAIGLMALKSGMEEDRVYFCNTGDEVFTSLQPLDDSTLILFKFPYKTRLSKEPSFQRLMKRVFFS